jgi:hypothetical protein
MRNCDLTAWLIDNSFFSFLHKKTYGFLINLTVCRLTGSGGFFLLLTRDISRDFLFDGFALHRRKFILYIRGV